MTCPYCAVAKVEIMPTDACQFFYECTGYGTKLKPKSVIWIIVLIWMGAARMLNARSCTRTHCRYIGPYYLAMTVPVMVPGAEVVTIGIIGWVCLGVIILGGSGLIWWATERAGGSSLSVDSGTLFTARGPLWVIFDPFRGLCLPLDVRFAPKRLPARASCLT
ncbi:GDCCVxC domain-containing (seleno)protein [Bradyrhizobium sp. LeoA1S1]